MRWSSSTTRTTSRRPDGALSVPAGEEVAAASTRSPRSGDYDAGASPRATGTRPTTARSPSRAGLAGALRRRARRARSCTRRSTRRRSTRSSTRARTRAPRATRRSTRTDARRDAARPRRRRGDGRRPGDRLLRQEHRARRAARGLRRARRPRGACAASRCSRATPSAPSTELRGGGCDRGVSRRRATTRASGCSRGCARTSPTRACCEAIARGPARPLRPRRAAPPRRGTTSRCRSAAGQTISQPLVVARMCELLELRGRRARARRRHGLGLPRRRAGAARARTCGAIERHAELSERAAANLARRGRARTSRCVVGDGARGLPGARAVRRDQRRRGGGRRVPHGAGRAARRRRAPGRARSRTATSGSCLRAPHAGGELRALDDARARALRAARWLTGG